MTLRNLSGRVRTRFDNLPTDNSEQLAPWGAEPYQGVPSSDNSILFYDTDGVRRFDVPPIFLPGNEIQAEAINEDIEVYHVFVDAIGTNSRFIADTGIRFNPFLNTMYIDDDLEVGQDIRVGGDVVVTGVVTSTSDMRVKENILRMEGALDSLSTFGAYTYNRTDLEGKPRQMGVLAQEIQGIYPELVEEASDGTLSVNYQGLTAVLLGAVKELKAQVDTLKQG